MKSIYHLALSIFLLIALQSKAQVSSYCGSTRYDTEVFSNVQLTSNVAYGSNMDYNGANVNLTMDIYEPAGDTASFRPLIVWAHGGSFLGGTKNDGDVTSLCNHFAKRGYVCISINYRLGMSAPNQATATQAVYRAVQDMKAAIRFMRKDAATANNYRIDPNFIIAGGSSAGAFTALHLAYLDQPSELPAQIDTSVLGNMEGNSGNPGYFSNVNVVVNLCGALGNKHWLIPGDKPLCSMHGTVDNIVPYSTAMLYMISIIPIMVVDGSYAINQYADSIGVSNAMYTFYGQSHVPYAGSIAYMDTTVRFVSNFLYSQLNCTPSDPNPLPNTFLTSGISSISDAGNAVQVYPNPSSNRIFVESTRGDEMEQILVYDFSGKIVKEIFCGRNKSASIEKGDLRPGIYMLSIRTGQDIITRIVSFQ